MKVNVTLTREEAIAARTMLTWVTARGEAERVALDSALLKLTEAILNAETVAKAMAAAAEANRNA